MSKFQHGHVEISTGKSALFFEKLIFFLRKPKNRAAYLTGYVMFASVENKRRFKFDSTLHITYTVQFQKNNV